MDGNKLQAIKTIDVVKRMILDRDYVGARAKLLEIQSQFPPVHNIAQMITTCDVLCASELTLPDGENDWYWILQVGRAASLSQIIVQHNNLSSLLEGIKDRFPGVDAALELVHKAFAVLSSRTQRGDFDSKRMTNWSVSDDLGSPASSVEKERDSLPVCESSVSHTSDPQKALGCSDEKCSTQAGDVCGSQNANDEACDIAPLEKEVPSSSANSTPSSLNFLPNTEVQKSNYTEACILDDDPPPKSPLPVPRSIQSQRINGHFHDFDGTREPDAFMVGQIWAAYDDEHLPRRYAQINDISASPFKLDVTWLQPVPSNSHEEKWCKAGLPVVCGSFTLDGGKQSLVEHTIFSHLVSYTASPMYDQFEIYPKENEIWAIYKDWKPFEWCENPESRRGCALQIVQMVEVCHEQEDESHMVVANLVRVDRFENIYRRANPKNICRRAIQESEDDCFKISSRCIYRFSHRLPVYEFEGGEMSGVSCGMFELDPLAMHDSYGSSSSYPNYQCPSSSLAPKEDSVKLEWSVEDFAPGQVWAVYDGFDHMPRQYVLVKNSISRCEVNVTFLDPHPISDEEISWVEENLPPGCGTFRIGSNTRALHMSKFSHLVDCGQSTKKSFHRIYPKKGEIWAMYTNWSPKWKQQDLRRCHCRIVEIMSDYSDNSGLLTTSLEEVPGYKTFFQRQVSSGFGLNRDKVVPKSEMLSFSHRVEAFVVPGIEMYGIPATSWHLEPDALPPLLAN